MPIKWKSIFRFKRPAWFKKVPRELIRIGDQIENLLFRTFGFSTARIYSRLFVEPRVVIKQGALPLTKRAAFYLMFPANGLEKSHIIALDHIVQSGYAPIVISNLPLTQPETEQVLQRCHAIVLRPNFGYDFAGHRDTIRLFRPALEQLDHLAILNDSVWFPAQKNANWLGQAEAKTLDYVGSVSHGGLPADAQDSDLADWRIDRDRAGFHYGSFSLLIGPAILRSPGFYRFWSDYRPSSIKANTIRRGEIGFTQWVIQNGFSHRDTLEIDDLPRLLAELPTDRLVQIARNAISFDKPKPNDMRGATINATPPDRAALTHLILKELVKSPQAYALQDFDLFDRGGSFIKKLPITITRTAGDQTLNILGRLPGPDAAVFRAEAEQIYRRKYGDPA